MTTTGISLFGVVVNALRYTCQGEITCFKSLKGATSYESHNSHHQCSMHILPPVSVHCLQRKNASQDVAFSIEVVVFCASTLYQEKMMDIFKEEDWGHQEVK